MESQEARLVAAYVISDADLEALSTARGKAVQAYLLQSGKVTSRLPITLLAQAQRLAGVTITNVKCDGMLVTSPT